MNRSYLAQSLTHTVTTQELSKKIAIHEAGHAAAIYLGNMQKQLPPVFFQIQIDQPPNHKRLSTTEQNWLARIEGGRLIHTLPSCIDEATREFSEPEKQAYLHAFEADIMNFLVGPLAEANYIALRDDEIINSSLITLSALRNYGGSDDLKNAYEYAECLFDNRFAQERKLHELFLQAFEFINSGAVWRAIMALANHLLRCQQAVIDCEEITRVLDTHFYHRKPHTGLVLQ
ncbi:hypothetical protein [Methylocucumis oryzae]|uniref:Peptidase M41 domain-containing protein n=1 Tax=Methylocucumis oryzae TaxID=1632867 RepID=A0A0F3IFG1_9GAMM|nr:hypothetical protein [Methylocucumis oryzae]KJV05501.1 hypothetical protein VZ94_17785 [Methylocucumis oryzae]